MMKKIIFIIVIVLCWSCTHNTKTEKYQGSRNNIVNVRDEVKEIKINDEDVIIGSVVRLFIIDNYLIIEDAHSAGKLIHIFDKNRFTYLTSIGDRGQGPNEITSIGFIATNNANHEFYVSDHGKQKIFAYNMDSVLINPDYSPTIKMDMNKRLFPDKYQYINDTLSIGSVVTLIGNNDFDQSVAQWNMDNGEIKPFSYKNPNVEKKRIAFAVSMTDSIYVECYLNYDLMTICSLNGNLKYNIYGPNWSSRKTNIHYFGKVVFCNDKILVSYSGGDWNTNYESSKFFIFDLTGNYIETLEIGYKITDYCYDKTNNQIIMNLNDAEMQFAYLDLNGIID